MAKVVRYLPKSEAAVHWCSQPFTEKRLFMNNMNNNKVAGLQPKKDTRRDVFLCVCLIFQNTFFTKHVWAVTASAKYHSFSLLRRPNQRNVTLDLGYVLIIFKYFQRKHYDSLVSNCFWKYWTTK